MIKSPIHFLQKKFPALSPYSGLEIFLLCSFSLILMSYFALRATPHRFFLYLALPFLLYYIVRYRPRDGARAARYLWLSLIAFWLYNLASTVWAPGAPLHHFLTVCRFEILAFAFTAGLGVFIARRPQAWPFLSQAFLTAARLAALFILIRFGIESAHNHFHLLRLQGTGRGGNSNICAALFSCAILFTLYGPHKRGHHKRGQSLFPLKVTVPGWLFLALFTLIVILTMGRGPLIALIFAVLAMEIVRRHFRRVGICLAACAAAFLFVLWNPADWGDIIKRGDDHRFDIWRKAFEIFAAHPLAGLGLGSDLDFTVSNYPVHFSSTHDVYLGALVYGGVIGLALYLALCAALFFYAWRSRRVEQTGLALTLYGLVFFLFEGHTQIVNLNPEWLFFYLPIALSAAYSVASPPSPPHNADRRSNINPARPAIETGSDRD